MSLPKKIRGIAVEEFEKDPSRRFGIIYHKETDQAISVSPDEFREITGLIDNRLCALDTPEPLVDLATGKPIEDEPSDNKGAKPDETPHQKVAKALTVEEATALTNPTVAPEVVIEDKKASTDAPASTREKEPKNASKV